MINFKMRNFLQSKIKVLTVLVLLLTSFACTKTDTTKILISTSVGEIFLDIDKKNAPVTATNFIHLCEKGVYSGAIFYRTVNDENQSHNKIKIDVIQDCFMIRLLMASLLSLMRQAKKLV